MRFAIAGVNGDYVDLSERGTSIAMQPNPLIFGPPPAQLTQQPATGRSAGEPDGPARHLARPVSFGLRLLGSNAADLRGLSERLNSMLDPTIGSIVLIVDAEDGSPARELRCKVTGGSFGIRHCLATSGTYQVIARAADPYWHSTRDDVQESSFLVGGLEFGSLNGVSVSTDVLNAGTASTWPRWTVPHGFSGPFTITNETSGRSWKWTLPTFTGGHTIVETREGARSIYNSASGVSTRRGLDPRIRDLFPLVPGLNTLSVEAFGKVDPIISAESVVSLTWRPRFLEC